MDYDDNDFQGQNPHLAGEGSSKFSPVLPPYPLPRFDFDEGLQGHLRFDSLVENEVFLGIPSQEENQWIEDFSRGSSVIEFSSSAAESCSISRRNNVWSEATSSESVEMLLKSVGQEEMVPGETILEESDACDEMGGLTEQMESHLVQDHKDKDVMDLEPTLPSARVQEHLNDVEGSSQSQEAKMSTHGSSHELDPNASSGTCGVIVTENNTGVYRKCDDVNQTVVDVTENESLHNKIQKEFSGSEMQTDDIDASLQDTSASVKVLNTQEPEQWASDVSFENACRSSKDSDKTVEEHHVFHKEADADDQYSNGTAVKTGTHTWKNVPCSSSRVELIEHHASGTGIVGFQEPSCLPLKEDGEPEIQIIEGCSEGLCSTDPGKAGKCEPADLSDSLEIHQQFSGNLHEGLHVVSEADCKLEGHATEISNVNAGNCVISELRIGQRTLVDNSLAEGEYPSRGSDRFLDTKASVTNSEAFLLSGIDEKLFDGQGDGSSSNYVRGISTLTEACSSSPKRGQDDASAVQKEDLHAEGHALSFNEAGPVQEYKVNPDPIDVHCNQDVSLKEKENAKLPNDTSNTDCEIVQSFGRDERVESSYQGEGVTVSNEEVHGSGCVTVVVNDHAPDVAFVNTNLASHVMKDGASLLSETVGTAEQVAYLLDKKSTSEDEDTPEANLSTLKDSLEGINGIDPVMGLGKVASSSATKLSDKAENQSWSMVETCNSESGSEKSLELQQKTADRSLPMTETSNTASGIEQAAVIHEFSQDSSNLLEMKVDQSFPMSETYNTASVTEKAVKANEIIQDSTSQLEVCAILSDSAIKEGDDVEGPGLGSHEVAAVGKNLAMTPSKVADSDLVADKGEVLKEPGVVPFPDEGNEAVVAAVDTNCGQTPLLSEDSGKPSSGTPSAIKCTAVSDSEKDDKEGFNGSVDTGIPLTELTVQSTSQNLTGNDADKDGRSFLFEVHPPAALSERVTGKDGPSVTTIQASKLFTIGEESPSTPSTSLPESKKVVELSHGSSQTPSESARGSSKGTTGRKTRRSSGRATGKENPRKGNHMKETTPLRQSERGGKSCSVSVIVAGTSQLVQVEGSKPYGNVEHSSAVSCGVVSLPTSNLPDLNTSAPTSALHRQPFTDLQQVQLRAQIFVYGSLIQGAVPDEAFMASAFGSSDGGMAIWKPTWHACLERIQGQKSLPNKSDTPVQPRSETRNASARPSDQSSKQNAVQSKVVSSPLGRASNKGTPSAVLNTMIPLSSPLWNISTPSDALQSSGMPRSGHLDYHQTLPPLHPFQTPPPRGFVGHNGSWLSQSPFPGPWIASPQTSAFDSSARLSVLPMMETVKLTPVKEFSAPVSSGSKHASPSAVVHASPNLLAGTASLRDMKKMTLLPGQNSSESKSRKRKKGTVSEDLGQISLLAKTPTESVSVPVVSCHLSTSVVVSTPPCLGSKGNANKIVTAVSPTSSKDYPKSGEHNAGQRVLLSEDTLTKVEEAEKQAEDAAALASAAVSHSLSVWSQLDNQKNCGRTPDVEAKLASAAVSVAAAASVAKAAAAAAQVASKIALRAKLMAEEASNSSRSSSPSHLNAASLSHVGSNLGKATPASILKGADGSNSSSSIVGAAREAARRRVEAASAASKHAEILDAIVKAAELAAEAVTQAGKIVAMGDPLPLNELVEAGPEGYWKVPQVPFEQGVILNHDSGDQSKVNFIEKGLNARGERVEEGPPEKEAQTTSRSLSARSREDSMGSMEDHMKEVDGISNSFTTSENDSRGGRSRRTSELAKTIGVIPESEIGSGSASVTAQAEDEKRSETLKQNGIKEGCLVEVRRDGDECKTAWFSAKVLSLKDGKALIYYTELQSGKGSGQLKEWVTLEGEGKNAPRIRIAHPMTTMRLEGTRKRRRAAMGDYVWSVGDRVDVWTQDCWREGVVTEKNGKDDTALTVHFPAEEETSVVKAWNIRPTLLWKDGEWVQWSNLKGKDLSRQGDTPQEKRLRLGFPEIESGEKDNMSINIEIMESGKPDQSRLLPLSANEKVFSVGKNFAHEPKPNLHGTIRSGLQKEGSRVIFGVPKPGKKRKFMEVSKHYVAERSSRTNQSNDSVKFAKYLMPQVSGSRLWKNNTKIDANEKQAAESKAKVLKSGKTQNIVQKGKFIKTAVSAQNDSSAVDNIKDSVSADENESEPVEFGSVSNTEGATVAPASFSSLALPSDAHRKKISTSHVKSEQNNRGKLATFSRKLAKAEVKDKLNNDNPGNSTSEIAEPRRSNRRIQPTSRLLEGLQSSLIISKIPAASQDKSHRSQNRGPKANNHG